MINLYNQTSAFFDVLKNNQSLLTALNDKVMSFSVTEEMMRLMQGSIQFYDPYNNLFNSILHTGSQINVNWGYKMPDSSVLSALSQMMNVDEVQGNIERGSNVRARVINVAGNADESGVITYSCNFMGSDVYGVTAPRIHNNITKFNIVIGTLSRMDVSPTNMLVDFERSTEMVGGDTGVIQWEGDFRFLARFARENGCIFCIGYGSTGKVGLFAHFNSTFMRTFQTLVGMSGGGSIFLDYKHGVANVESYSFQQQVSDSTGDNAQITMINGVPTVQRFHATSQEIVDYAINMDKIQADMAAVPGVTNRLAFMQQLLSINSFETLVNLGYFSVIRRTTAPQGYGWSLKIKTLGNPLVTAPTRVIFGHGFPELFSGNRTSFWVRSVTHSVTSSGYHMDLDIVDALTLSGGSMVS